MPCAVVLPMIAIPETPPMSSQQGGTLFLISSLRMSKRGGRGSSSINYDLESGKEWDRRYRCACGLVPWYLCKPRSPRGSGWLCFACSQRARCEGDNRIIIGRYSSHGAFHGKFRGRNPCSSHGEWTTHFAGRAAPATCGGSAAFAGLDAAACRRDRCESVAAARRES